MTSEPPPFDLQIAGQLIGKRVLIGLTYVENGQDDRLNRNTELSKTSQTREWRFVFPMARPTGFLRTFGPGRPLPQGSIGFVRRAKWSLIRTSWPTGR
jgi:hypothetical protein